MKLYDSMSRSKLEFHPREAGTVKIFTCGPSTYRRPHIGNYRTFLYEDILVRYLRWKGFDVRRTINFTDVEDKTIVEAEHKGKNVADVTRDVHDRFFRETELLGILLPDEIPRSSTSVDQAVQIIQKLIQDGFAYWHKGDVFFDPLKKEDFGKLFQLDMSTWPRRKVRFRRDTYNGRRWNRGDFVLWHGHENEPNSTAYWDTAIGKGRPSWNIQDPAMILQQLGTQVDINCGGIDNIYRHHDYNIAVMEAYSGKPYASYYMHGEHLIVDGKSMSKSRDNILYPEDLTAEGYEQKHLRFFLIYRHYRKKLNFTDEAFGEASKRLDDFRATVARITTGSPGVSEAMPEAASAVERIPKVFEHIMDDDLRVGDSFDAVHEALRGMEKILAGRPLAAGQASTLTAHLRKIDEVYGVIFPR